MKKLLIAGVVMAGAITLIQQPAMAAGCASGAVVGGVAGHVAGHHGVLGAAAGCAVGHHEANKQERAAPMQNQNTTRTNGANMTGTSGNGSASSTTN